MILIVASALVFIAGLLLLAWQTHWAPRRRWARLRPRFIDWVALAVESDRRDAAYVERMTKTIMESIGPPPDHRR